MSLSGFDNYSSVRSSLKLLIEIVVHFQKCWTPWKNLQFVMHDLYVVQLKICASCMRWTPIIFPDMQRCSNERGKPKCPHPSWFQYSRIYGRANQSCFNVLLIPKSLRNSQCGDVDTECWVHCLSLWQMRMVNFPVTSTAFVPCEYFHSVGQAQLCTALSLMLESIISQLLGRLTDVCCTNKGFQLESGG